MFWVVDGGNGLMLWKILIILFFNINDLFNFFGYEVEDVYQELIENDEYYDYYYFCCFKMMLYGKMVYVL